MLRSAWLSRTHIRSGIETEVIDESHELVLSRDIQLLIGALPICHHARAFNCEVGCCPINCHPGNDTCANLNFALAEASGNALQ